VLYRPGFPGGLIADWRIQLADTVAAPASNGAMATADRGVPTDDLDVRLIGMCSAARGQS
jgi:2-keto-4-pentenoate hydratase